MFWFFFFHDTATPEIYTYGPMLSRPDALPVGHDGAYPKAARADRHRPRIVDCRRMTDAFIGYSTHRLYATRHANGRSIRVLRPFGACRHRPCAARGLGAAERKSTRLNSSH